MTNLTTSANIRLFRNNYIGPLAYLSQEKPYVIPVFYRT